MITTNLKNLRNTHNYTQKDISKLLNISLTGYASWEQGLSQPNTEYLIKLSKIYKCSIDYIVSNQNNHENIEYSETPIISYLDKIYFALTKIGKAKLESYAEGLLASENADKLYIIQKEKKGE